MREAMPLPEPDYYRLEQVAKRWEASCEQVQHFLETGKLACHIWPKPCWAEKGILVKQVNGTEVFHAEKRVWRKGFLRLIPEDCRWVFRYGQTNSLQFMTTDESYTMIMCLDGQYSLLVEEADMLILRKDIEVFEERFNIRSIDSDEDSDRFIYTDNYQTVSIGEQNYRFGWIQAKIIETLHQASQTSNPWVHGKTLLHAAGSQSTQVKNVFRSQRNWRDLIYSDGRGYYRLKL